MNSRRSAAQQVDTLRRSMHHSELRQCLRIFPAFLKLGSQFIRQCRAETLSVGGARNRHDARDNRYGDPRRARSFAKLPVAAIIEKQLCNEKIDAGIDLP